MSRIINVHELSGHQQDVLWSNICPYCSANIEERDSNVDYAYFHCGYCDITFIVE